MATLGKFQKTETIICKATVREDGALTNPSTSITATITDPVGTEVVSATGMSNVSTGVYTYDYTPASTVLSGVYIVRYKATDGTRITIEDDEFELE